MTQFATENLTENPRKQCDALVARGGALLAADYRYLDPEMVKFVNHYLYALACDVEEAIRAENEEQRVLLPFILGELCELVEDIQHRIERAKGALLNDKELKDDTGRQKYS